jgi:hypothetical protein
VSLAVTTPRLGNLHPSISLSLSLQQPVKSRKSLSTVPPKTTATFTPQPPERGLRRQHQPHHHSRPPPPSHLPPSAALATHHRRHHRQHVRRVVSSSQRLTNENEATIKDHELTSFTASRACRTPLDGSSTRSRSSSPGSRRSKLKRSVSLPVRPRSPTARSTSPSARRD